MIHSFHSGSAGLIQQPVILFAGLSGRLVLKECGGLEWAALSVFGTQDTVEQQHGLGVMLDEPADLSVQWWIRSLGSRHAQLWHSTVGPLHKSSHQINDYHTTQSGKSYTSTVQYEEIQTNVTLMCHLILGPFNIVVQLNIPQVKINHTP